jgi:hypothetical protein
MNLQWASVTTKKHRHQWYPSGLSENCRFSEVELCLIHNSEPTRN